MDCSENDVRLALIERIEGLACAVFTQIIQSEAPQLTISCSGGLRENRAEKGRRYSVIGFGRRQSVGKFGAMMRVLASIHSLLVKNRYCTKRDLYYQDPELYRNQRYIDGLIDTISVMLNVPRWHLHVVATSKGVIAGCLEYLDMEKKLVDCSQSQNGVLLPSLIHKVEIQRTMAKFVLIVEKDATFQHLLEGKAVEKLGPCLIVTAKGYPDLSTRQFVNMIYTKYPSLPFYALVDADPHGVCIYLTYKFGSLVHAHDGENLNLPTLQWLGILPSDMDNLQLSSHTMIELSTRERAQIQDLMNREYMKILVQEKAELTKMLEKNNKAEIQSLDTFGRNYLIDVYLPYRLGQAGMR